MCIIVDSNQWGDFLKYKEDMKPIHQWLENQNGKLVYSNHETFKREINQKTFIEYSRAGKTKFFSSEKVNSEIEKIQNQYTLKSNDMHILGLAKASNTKVLCTHDKKLHEDFKNVIHGRVYQNESHRHLLTKDICL